jgi:hypothetical protein
MSGPPGNLDETAGGVRDGGAERYARDPVYAKPPQWGRLYGKFFPIHTDPTSRHCKVVAEALRNPSSEVRRWLIDNGYEPDHWATALEGTVKMLWETRAMNARAILDRIKASFFDRVLDNVAEEHREEVLYALTLAMSEVTARRSKLLRTPQVVGDKSREDA